MPTHEWTLKKPVVMVGMMGAGKTAVGKALAARLGVKFMDSDQEIERAANMSIHEIFERDGEAFFRDREAEVISRLMAGEQGIVSVGGGAFLQEQNRATISEKGVALWLRADLDLLWQRVRHKNTRPLLRTANPRATLATLLHEREPFYRLAGLSTQSRPGLSIAEMVDRVIETLETRPDILERAG